MLIGAVLILAIRQQPLREERHSITDRPSLPLISVRTNIWRMKCTKSYFQAFGFVLS